jgi:hypothetical protein
MLVQRNEANTALADQRSGNSKLKSDQERQFTDLAEQHRDEIDELNENFATAMGMCQPRLHRVRQAKLAAQKWKDKIELIRATIEKLDGRVAELTRAIPILKQKEAAAADAVPDTVSPMEEAQTTAHAAHTALSAATNANASTLPALRDAKKAADSAFVAALTTHQTAAQDAEWATRHRQEAEESLEADTAASATLTTSELPEMQQAAAASVSELEAARAAPAARRSLLGSGEVDVDAENSENEALQSELVAAGQLRESYQNQRDAAQRTRGQEQGVRPELLQTHADKVKQENLKHAAKISEIRPQFLHVMDLCQRHAWQVDKAKRAVATRVLEHDQAVAKVSSATQAIEVEKAHQAQAEATLEQSVASLATAQDQTAAAVAADQGVLEAEEAQQAVQEQVETAQQSLAEVQTRLREAEASLAAASAFVAAGDAAIAALKEDVKKAAVGSCYSGDCAGDPPEVPANVNTTANSTNSTNTTLSNDLAEE